MARVFGKVAVGIESPLSDTNFGPIVEPKKVESVFSRVEKPKQLPTFKPPIGEPNKWYSMEFVSVKPPQKRHFKYGYNPYFPQMNKRDTGLGNKCISLKSQDKLLKILMMHHLTRRKQLKLKYNKNEAY